MTNTRKCGSGYEQAAADFLMKQGYEILEMNYHIRHVLRIRKELLDELKETE